MGTMFLQAIKLQEAKDTQVLAQTNRNAQEIDRIHEKTQDASELLGKIVHARDPNKKEISLEHLRKAIEDFKNNHPSNFTDGDPFKDIHPGPLNKIKTSTIDRVIYNLQELMRRYSNELEKLARDSEYAMQLYILITEMLAKQNPNEERTTIDNQRA